MLNVRLISSLDIDTIEIRADEEEGSGAAKARRTYNYRVCLLFKFSYIFSAKVTIYANIKYAKYL